MLSLTSLMQSTAPYRIESSDGHVFLLNVCGPLPRAKKMGCKDDSAACMLQSDTRSTYDKPLVRKKIYLLWLVIFNYPFIINI